MAEEKKEGAFPVAKGDNAYPPKSTRVGQVELDPNDPHLPSNVRQREEAKRRENEELITRVNNPPNLLEPTQHQAPGAGVRLPETALAASGHGVSERTRKEMEGGAKRVETATNAAKDRDRIEKEREEVHKREVEQQMQVIGDTGEQLEAKRKEAERQRETWGEVPGERDNKSHKSRTTAP